MSVQNSPLVPAHAGQTFTHDGQPVTILPKCSATASGQWICVTCDAWLAHNFAMQTHTSTGRHIMAWKCHQHGIEQP